ncbi:MAG: hypothetical protein ACYSXF_04650 [Planctomycetota bacterium]|jgi:hypothetical protein
MIGSLDEARAMLAGTLIIVGGALATAVVWNLIWRKRGGCGLTYRRLCRSLGLDGPQRRLVAQIARAAGIDHASSLLVSRGCFDLAVRRCIGGRRPDRRLAAIRQRVFGEGTPTSSGQAPARRHEGT